MQRKLIHETFAGPTLHPALKWLNPPPAWELDPVAPRLVVYPASPTDFWQRTHYGFRADRDTFSMRRYRTMPSLRQESTRFPFTSTTKLG